MTIIGSAWGVHDRVPDYKAFSSPEDFTAADPYAQGGPSGCGFYRIVVPFDELARHGWRTAYSAGTPPPAFEEYRIVTGQRLDKHAALPDWRRMRLKHRLIYEIDDDVFSIDKLNWMAHGVFSRSDTRDAVIHAAQVADIVTVSTGPLAEVMASQTGHPDIRVLPNCIPDGVLDIERYRNRRKVTAGWQGGASHAADIAMIAPAVRDFLDLPKTEFHLVGTDYSKTVGRKCRFTPWIPAAADLAYYQRIDFDIGLAPLTGTRFDQSKSAIKVLEYGGLGIPSIASDVTPYRDVVVDGVTGWLVRTPEDWSRRLRDLACDPAMRDEMGAKAREVAAAHAIGACWQQWADVYEELL